VVAVPGREVLGRRKLGPPLLNGLLQVLPPGDEDVLFAVAFNEGLQRLPDPAERRDAAQALLPDLAGDRRPRLRFVLAHLVPARRRAAGTWFIGWFKLLRRRSECGQIGRWFGRFWPTAISAGGQFGRWRTSRRSAVPLLSSGRFGLRQIRPMVAHDEMVRVRGVRAVLTDPRLPRDHPHLLKRRQVAPHRPDALRRQPRDLRLRRPAHAVFVGEVCEREEHQLRARLRDILLERPCDRLYAHLNKPGGWNPGRPRAG